LATRLTAQPRQITKEEGEEMTEVDKEAMDAEENENEEEASASWAWWH